jgi:hypothetical protein
LTPLVGPPIGDLKGFTAKHFSASTLKIKAKDFYLVTLGLTDTLKLLSDHRYRHAERSLSKQSAEAHQQETRWQTE